MSLSALSRSGKEAFHISLLHESDGGEMIQYLDLRFHEKMPTESRHNDQRYDRHNYDGTSNLDR